MEHITRVARIIDLPRGNAMLVGVGGSGKQSLARLASYICNYEVFQISVSSTYGVTEFKENLLSLYRRVREWHGRRPITGSASCSIVPLFRILICARQAHPEKVSFSMHALFLGRRQAHPRHPYDHLLPFSGRHQGHPHHLPHDRQPDREGAVPGVHKRSAVDRLHRGPVHARRQGSLFQCRAQ
eukprot:1161047-Pelagomonas_calceolata.AAC.40